MLVVMTGSHGGRTMRIVELSNHPEQMRAGHASARLDEQARQAQARADARSQLAELRSRQWQALRQFRLGEWIRVRSAIAGARRQLAPFPSIASSVPPASEEKFAAGRDGENRIAAGLKTALPDDAWVLFRGYRSARGEIDGVLAGPGGIVAIEVKNLNGVIHVNGDHWQRDKYDRRGSLVRSEPLPGKDAPSIQVNRAADALERFLARRGHAIRIRRVVVLAHGSSRTGTLTGLTIDGIGTSASTVLKLLDSTPVLSPGELAGIERLIRRDHDYNERRHANH
jgi:Nuclease-related domain